MESIFKNDLVTGKAGELAFVEYLKAKNIKFKDVSDIKEYQVKGIDLLIRIGKAIKGVDVKTNFNEDLKEVVFEEYSNIERKNLGWTYTSEADYILLVDKKKLNVGYLLKYSEVKDRYEQVKHQINMDFPEDKLPLYPLLYNDNIFYKSSYRKIPLEVFDGQYKTIILKN